MNKYQYQILHYRHDVATGEFVNVGVVVYQPESNFLQAKILNKYARISQFFENVNGQFILGMLKSIAKGIADIAQTLNAKNNLSQKTNRILPQDDGSLYFSEVKNGMDISLDIALADLFERFVNKHQPKESNYKTDEYVWKESYKKYFDEYGITSKFSKHTIQTQSDEFVFDRVIKNGSTSIYEPSSFDLSEETSIKDKVYKLAGKFAELDSYQEFLHLYLLTAMPKSDKMRKFIEQKLLNKDLNHIQVHLIVEDEANQFAQKLQAELEAHSH